MNVEEYINIIKLKYENGSTIFNINDNLKMITKEIPKNKKGIYTFNYNNKIMYIGMAGTHRRGTGLTENSQGLFGRINNTTGKIQRSRWIPIKMKEQNIEKITINWFVSYDLNRQIKDIPAYVESYLLKLHIDEFNDIPIWNEKF